MSSLAVLVAPSGRPQATLQLLCDGVPLRGLPHVDGATGRANVRFVAPHPGGRLTVRVANGGVKDGVFLQLERAELGPKDAWEGCEPGVVNKANVLFHGTNLTVDRDESCGGRSILVEPLRDAQGRALGEADAEVRGLRRTKWRLGVWPKAGFGEEVFESEWRLVDTKMGLREVPLHVKTPTGDTILAASDTVSLDWLKEGVERELGIPRAEQRLRAPDGSCPAKLADVVGPRFQTLLVCGKQRVGANLWFYVRHKEGEEFLEALSSDTVASVLERVRSLAEVPKDGGDLDGLHQDGTELRADRTLADYNVACLDTLELRERGSLRVAVAVEFAGASPPKTVEVGVDPDDSVAELRRRVVVKAVAEPLKRRRLERNEGVVLRLGDQELPGHRSVEECGLDALPTGQRLVNCLIPSFDSWMQIYIKSWTKKYSLPCASSDSVEMIKLLFADVEGVPVNQLRLYFDGSRMQNNHTLADYDIMDKDTLRLYCDHVGGGGPSVFSGLQVDDEAAEASSLALTVGKIRSGEVVPPPRTKSCEFPVELFRQCPWLQFDVFVK